MNKVVFGIPTNTVTEELLMKTGMSSQTASLVNDGLSLFASMGGVKGMQMFKAYNQAFSFNKISKSSNTHNELGLNWHLPENGGGAKINKRWYTEHALERMAPNTPLINAKLQKRFLERAKIMSSKISPEEYVEWYKLNKPNPRGIPASVVEAEIAKPGKTGIRVILNKDGDVVTIIPGK